MLSPEKSIAQKDSYGGTSFDNVKKMINLYKKELKIWKILY